MQQENNNKKRRIVLLCCVVQSVTLNLFSTPYSKKKKKIQKLFCNVCWQDIMVIPHVWSFLFFLIAPFLFSCALSCDFCCIQSVIIQHWSEQFVAKLGFSCQQKKRRKTELFPHSVFCLLRKQMEFAGTHAHTLYNQGVKYSRVKLLLLAGYCHRQPGMFRFLFIFWGN